MGLCQVRPRKKMVTELFLALEERKERFPASSASWLFLPDLLIGASGNLSESGIATRSMLIGNRQRSGKGSGGRQDFNFLIGSTMWHFLFLLWRPLGNGRAGRGGVHLQSMGLSRPNLVHRDPHQGTQRPKQRVARKEGRREARKRQKGDKMTRHKRGLLPSISKIWSENGWPVLPYSWTSSRSLGSAGWSKALPSSGGVQTRSRRDPAAPEAGFRGARHFFRWAHKNISTRLNGIASRGLGLVLTRAARSSWWKYTRFSLEINQNTPAIFRRKIGGKPPTFSLFIAFLLTNKKRQKPL